LRSWPCCMASETSAESSNNDDLTASVSEDRQ
jgi:hypothetical protein